MVLKSKFKPKYKKLISLKENIQNYNKILNFKKKKWAKLIQIYIRKLKLYNKIKPKDYNQHLVSRYTSLTFAYKRRYKNVLQETNKFKLMYGGFTTKKIKMILNKKSKIISPINFLKLFENRLDVILYRAKFVLSIREAGQIIYQGKILLNNKTIKIKSYVVKSGDIITVKTKYLNKTTLNVLQLNWPICQKHLLVNYKTSQIICNFLNNNISLNSFYHVDFEKILAGYYQH